MIRELLAQAHAWVGESALDAGQQALARRHFAASLRHKPWQPALLARCPLAMVPARSSRRLRACARAVKKAARPLVVTGANGR